MSKNVRAVSIARGSAGLPCFANNPAECAQKDWRYVFFSKSFCAKAYAFIPAADE